MEKLTKNFYKEEFTKSTTAENNRIDNSLPKKYEDNLKKLSEQLQIIRDEFNEPIVVSSGYRCIKLNKKVGGVKNSDHLYGCAADIKTTTDKLAHNKRLWDIIVKLAKEKKIHLRQIIHEYGNTIGPDWIHVSVNNIYNGYRDNQIVYVK